MGAYDFGLDYLCVRLLGVFCCWLFPPHYSSPQESSNQRICLGDVPRLCHHLPSRYRGSGPRLTHGLRPPNRSKMGYGILSSDDGRLSLPVLNREYPSLQHRLQPHGVFLPVDVQRRVIWLDTGGFPSARERHGEWCGWFLGEVVQYCQPVDRGSSTGNEFEWAVVLGRERGACLCGCHYVFAEFDVGWSVDLNEWEIDLGEQITSKLLRRLFYSGMHAQSFHRFMRLGRRTHLPPRVPSSPCKVWVQIQPLSSGKMDPYDSFPNLNSCNFPTDNADLGRD